LLSQDGLIDIDIENKTYYMMLIVTKYIAPCFISPASRSLVALVDTVRAQQWIFPKLKIVFQ
jgi:hypothetical protein